MSEQAAPGTAGGPDSVNGTPRPRIIGRYLAMRPRIDRKVQEYKRVLAETADRRQQAVKTLRRAGYLRE